MRVLLFGFGSRGDVQPFVALGKGLQGAGYDVTIAAGVNFQSWIEQEGLKFDPVHVDIEAVMQTDVGKNWLEASSHNPMTELQNMRRMVEVSATGIADDVIAMLDKYDTFISGVLTVVYQRGTDRRAYGGSQSGAGQTTFDRSAVPLGADSQRRCRDASPPPSPEQLHQLPDGLCG